MASRSLNKVQLIGNLTRDPELRYTPTGAAVCTIGLATNRSWVADSGEKKEETEFHRVVAWNKLAELCSQLLTKGRKIYVEGRLRTNSWQAADGAQRTSTEVVIEDMMILDSKHQDALEAAAPTPVPTPPPTSLADAVAKTKRAKAPEESKTPPAPSEPEKETVNPDDIPF